MRAPTSARLACISDEEEDRALAERVRQGDREAFTALVVRYQRPVYNAALWVLRRAEDASDVSETVFLKVAERIDDYDPRFKFFSWIYRIAVNESLNLLRRHDREQPLGDDYDADDDGAADPERRLDAAERSQHVRRALMRMATNDRLVLMLRHFSDCSYDEMAQILGLDEKTVKSRLYEARQRLRGLLEALR